MATPTPEPDPSSHRPSAPHGEDEQCSFSQNFLVTVFQSALGGFARGTCTPFPAAFKVSVGSAVASPSSSPGVGAPTAKDYDGVCSALNELQASSTSGRVVATSERSAALLDWLLTSRLVRSNSRRVPSAFPDVSTDAPPTHLPPLGPGWRPPRLRPLVPRPARRPPGPTRHVLFLASRPTRARPGFRAPPRCTG